MTAAFAAPVWLRLAAAGAATALAWAAVWLVESRPAATPRVAAPVAVGTRSITVACTAGRPVARWRVAVDGVEVDGSAGDQAWQGRLGIPDTRCEVVVEADPGRPGPTALRVQVDGAGSPLDRTAWGDGPARVTLLLPGARR